MTTFTNGAEHATSARECVHEITRALEAAGLRALVARADSVLQAAHDDAAGPWVVIRDLGEIYEGLATVVAVIDQREREGNGVPAGAGKAVA